MDKFGRVRFRVEGLSMERLLNQCAQAGVRLYDVRRRSLRSIAASAAPKDFDALRAFAGERGWRVTQERAAGVSELRGAGRRRALLIGGVAAFLMACWYASSCLWAVEITGAGAYEAEVRRILTEQDARPGRFAAFVHTDALRAEIERQLTGLSWVGVYKSGVRLRVQCVQAETAPREERDAGALVAAQDGVVRSVLCRAGTPKVKPGDTVRAGDVLIAGFERGENETLAPVRAEGSVLARVWYTGEAFVSSRAERAEPDGEPVVRRLLCMPDWKYAFETAPDFIQYEKETRTLRIGGGLPVWLEEEIYRPVRTEIETRSADEVKAEAGLAAMRIARENAGWDAEIVDKWVDYSMIQEEGYRARAVVEALREIAVRPSEGNQQ